MKPSLSVIIITKNEAERIGMALESVRFADEIVVLDSGSTDATLEIARRYTDKVHTATDWQGFGVQKNRALNLASGEWVLSLDADEWVDADLRREIEATLATPTAAVYEMPRLSRFCGRAMRHSGWWPDYVPRLFRRGSARFSDSLVHERLLFEGVPGRFFAPLQHDSFRNLEEVLDKINRYSTAGAKEALTKGRRGGLSKALMRGLWAFVRTYFLRAGFLDGREGLIQAISSAEGVYYRYLKLGYLRDKSRPV
jgi:glycosyltransferase involved in cell wall biosynthesis